MSTEQRRLLADKLCDAANVAAGALIFGQFVSGSRFSATLAMAGALAWLVIVGTALAISRE